MYGADRGCLPEVSTAPGSYADALHQPNSRPHRGVSALSVHSTNVSTHTFGISV